MSSSCWMESGGAFLSEIQACFFLFGVTDGDDRRESSPYRPVLIQLFSRGFLPQFPGQVRQGDGAFQQRARHSLKYPFSL